MFQQLRLGDASEQVSWTRMFQVMKQYCARYAPPQEAQVRRACVTGIPVNSLCLCGSHFAVTACVNGLCGYSRVRTEPAAGYRAPYRWCQKT